MRPKLPRLPFRSSLRFRVLASFALIVSLSLFLAGAGSVWLIRHQQAEAAERGIGRLVDVLNNEWRDMQMRGLQPEQVAGGLTDYSRYFGVRILLLDGDQRVTLDTNSNDPAVGEQITEAARGPAPASGPGEPYQSRRIKLQGRDVFMFTSTRQPATSALTERPTGNNSLILTVPADDVTSAWARLLPRLLFAGGLAALFAAIMGTLLVNRITKPILQMTRASEAMAEGDYSQRVEVAPDEDDEVAHLGRAFNQMALQVDRSSRAMRQLLANVSHDLKTPLTSIQGYSQAMVDGVIEPDELAGAAEIVHQEAERMRSLVEDLLYLSQLEAGQSQLNLELLDLDAAVAATANRFRFQAEVAYVEVALELNGGTVMADERRIEQVLANLLDNAIRFAPAGTKVSLTTAREDGHATVTVHNWGDPIPPADLPNIFDRFYQVDEARTRRGHSGLGLSIVRELVQAHGGDVTARSSAEAGTSFTVQLPASDIEVAVGAGRIERAARPAGADGVGAPELTRPLTRALHSSRGSSAVAPP